MTELQFKKKNRNNIKPGDLFAFRMDSTKFGFGRIVSQTNLGHIAELFDHFDIKPTLEATKNYQVFRPLIVLDAYGLFQRKSEGDWGIIGVTPNYVPSAETANTRFAWGLKGQQKTTDIYGNTLEASDVDAANLPRYQPWGDDDVKDFIERKSR